MSSYKNVRLEEHVYQELIKRQLPRESMSQVIERIMTNSDEIYRHLRAALAAAPEDKQ